MLARLRGCLDDNGILDSKQISEVSPRQDRTKSALPYTQLSPDNSAVFCRDAAETITHNVLLSCSQPDSGFYLFDLRPCFNSIENLAADGTLLSAFALSALVHMSKQIWLLDLFPLQRKQPAQLTGKQMLQSILVMLSLQRQGILSPRLL